MSSPDDIHNSSTLSSSTINFGIFSYNINRDENNEISSYNNICTDTSRVQSEYLGSNNRIIPFQDSSNTINNQYLNLISNHETENNDDDFIKDIYFIVPNKKQKDIFKTTNILKNKRGRKEGTIDSKKKPSLKNKKKKYTNHNKKKIIHDNTKQDNLQRKIHVHFLSFLVNISNDALKTEIKKKDKNYNFKNIAHKIKLKINEKYFNSIKSLSIKDILKNDISPKFSTFDKDENKNILNKISLLSNNWLNEFFSMTYLDLLNYYYTEQKIDKIVFNKQEILFSEKTKTFYDLLDKKSNKDIKEQLKEVLFRIFFSKNSQEFENNGKIKFAITKKNNFN